MGDVVDLVLVQRDRAYQVDLDFVAGGDRAQQRGTVPPGLLRHRQQRRDVVAGMAVLGGQESVVVVQLAHRRAVGPGRPFGMHPHVRRAAEQRGAARPGMGQRLVPRANDRVPVDRGDGDRRVVDHPVDDHLGHLGQHVHRVGRDGGDLPRQLVLARQAVGFRVNAHVVYDHWKQRSWASWRLYRRRPGQPSNQPARPEKLAGRFSRKAETPSAKSGLRPASRCNARSVCNCASQVDDSADHAARRIRPSA